MAEQKTNGSRRVVNIINFVRGCEPRDPSMDLYTPAEKELRLCKKYGFPNTFLLQYDAMLRGDFKELFRRETDESTEFGVWIEIVRPLAEAVEIPWRGRPGFDWDWYVNPGFLMAYPQEQRKLLIDELMRLFRETFGAYPRSAGSWLLDAWSMEYMTEAYGIRAFAICREQLSVDAYTLWGGYYNQGYFPSRRNMLCPAQTESRSAPVFRMLGIDPVYGYDAEGYRSPYRTCNTLEPAWESGADAACVDWYFHTYFENECLNFAYAQLGQENSFGWPKFGAGLTMQMKKLKAFEQKGAVAVEKLCETGEWFSANFRATPATALVADIDWAGNGYRSCWYDCRNYRANVFAEGKHVFFRDIFRFDERFEEAYYTEPCLNWEATYENLPVVDGLSWSEPGNRAELGLSLPAETLRFERRGKNALAVLISGTGGESAEILMEETGITVLLPQEQSLIFRRAKDGGTKLKVMKHSLVFTHRGFLYEIPVTGMLSATPDGFTLAPMNGTVGIGFGRNEE